MLFVKFRSVVSALQYSVWIICFQFMSFNNLYAKNNDIFLQLQGFNGEVCQGTRIENKIITSALCFCKLYSKDTNDLKEIISLFKKKKDKTKVVKLLNTSLGSEIDVSANIYIDEHACRYAEQWRNESHDYESSKLLYDRYFFDVAILDIVNLPSEFNSERSFPNITCIRPRHNDFVANGKMGIITRNETGKVDINQQRFAIMNKPNQWYAGLELFFTGYRITEFKEHFSINEKQNGAPLISLTDSLLMKNDQGRMTHAYDFQNMNNILQNEEYDKIFIPGITTHGEKIDLSKGRAVYGVPFFNVKKLLKKHIPSKYLSSDCLTGDKPEGFYERVEIY